MGLSIATLLSQHHKVYAVDIVPAKVDMVNQRKSPIQDEYIEKYSLSVSPFLPSNNITGSCVFSSTIMVP